MTTIGGFNIPVADDDSVDDDSVGTAVRTACGFDIATDAVCPDPDSATCGFEIRDQESSSDCEAVADLDMHACDGIHTTKAHLTL